MKPLTVEDLAGMQREMGRAIMEMQRATSMADAVTQALIARLGAHFTVDEAAAAWRVTPKTIRRKIAAGELRLEKIPGTHVTGIPAEQIFGRWIDYRIARAAKAREHAATKR
jgi:excisionase family DNA binding protein